MPIGFVPEKLVVWPDNLLDSVNLDVCILTCNANDYLPVGYPCGHTHQYLMAGMKMIKCASKRHNWISGWRGPGFAGRGDRKREIKRLQPRQQLI